MANRTWRGTTDSNWGTATNWLEGAVPLVTDDVIFDASSPACNINTSNRVAKTVTWLNYTNTITFDFNLSVSGNITLGTSATFAGSATLICVANATLTSNGKILTVNFSLEPGTAGGNTYTLADAWTVSSNVSLGNANSTSTGCLINGFSITCGTNLTFNNSSSRFTTGTTNLIMNGSGNLSGVGQCRCSISINTSGTITIGNLIWGGTGKTFERIAGGTVNVTTDSTLTLLNFGGTLDLGSIEFENITHQGGASPVYTLTSSLSCNKTYTVSAGAITWNTSTGSKIYLRKDFVQTSSGQLAGTAIIEYAMTGGTGTWSSTGAFIMISNFVINNSGGTLTISGNVYYGGTSGQTFLYSAGNIDSTTANLFLSTGSYNISGIPWLSVQGQSSAQITLLADINTTNFVALNVITTWNGSSFQINTSNSINASALTSGRLNGDSKIYLTGNSIVGSGSMSGWIALSIEIVSSGTVTLSSNLHFRSNTTVALKHTSGTINGGTSVVDFSGVMEINASGMNFNTLNLNGSNFTNSFTGNFGWTSNTFTISTGTYNTYTFTSDVIYTINTLMQLIGTAASRIIMLSSIGGSYAYLNLVAGSTQTNGYVNVTDINSSGGITIFDWQGVLTNTVNWNLLTPPKTSAYTYIAE